MRTGRKGEGGGESSKKIVCVPGRKFPEISGVISGFFRIAEKSWFFRVFPGRNPEPGIPVETLRLPLDRWEETPLQKMDDGGIGSIKEESEKELEEETVEAEDAGAGIVIV